MALSIIVAPPLTRYWLLYETKIAGIGMHPIYGSVVCSENEVIFGMLTFMSISWLPTLEMHWSVKKANFDLQ